MNFLNLLFRRQANRIWRPLLFSFTVVVTGVGVQAQDQAKVQTQDQSQSDATLFRVTDPENKLVPQYLLPCIHASEVQVELGLTEAQVETLESILKDLDARWWPARNFELEKQRATVAALETELLQKLTSNFPLATVQRLQQLEMQAQGARSMLRTDVAEKLGVNQETQKRFLEFAEQTEKELATIQESLKLDPKQDFSEKISEIKKTEILSGVALLSDSQKQAMSKALGTRLNFTVMERIYPLAPELIDSQEWAGSPTKLGSLRGKVVLVHFYAFQCSNCRNNFGRYIEWTENFKNQDVEIVGIQTPETYSESNPALVREAAEKDKLRFPILIDLKSENWKAWGNTMWPTVYVIDKQGYIRMWWQGELNWQGATGDQKIVEVVNKLLKE